MIVDTRPCSELVMPSGWRPHRDGWCAAHANGRTHCPAGTCDAIRRTGRIQPDDGRPGFASPGNSNHEVCRRLAVRPGDYDPLLGVLSDDGYSMAVVK